MNRKLEHIALMLNRRTNGKKYENLVVNAIYAKLAEPNLIPVTQQYVRGERGIYLLDLYFPQLNIGVEVDEPQHETESHRQADELRAEDIMSAIECDEIRIRIEGNSYEQVVEQIDSAVATIREAIKRHMPLKWLSYDEELLYKKDNEQWFDTADTIRYQKISDIYNLLGHNAKNLQKSFIRLNANYFLWSPILTIADKDGNIIDANNKYHNWFNHDKTAIYEQKADGSGFDWEEWEKGRRVVFMNQRDRLGRKVRIFAGVYEPEEYIDNIRSYRRIATHIDFNKLK